MVNVELTDVDWLEPTVLTLVFLMDCVWVYRFVVGFLVDSFALVSSTKGWRVLVSKFDFGKATD